MLLWRAHVKGFMFPVDRCRDPAYRLAALEASRFLKVMVPPTWRNWQTR